MARLVCVLVLFATVPVSAQTRTSQAMFIGGNVADVVTTCQAFSRGAVEGNPLAGGKDATCKSIAVRNVVLNGGLLAFYGVYVKKHPDAKGMASWLLTSFGIVHGAMAIHNHFNGRTKKNAAPLSATFAVRWGR